MSEKSALSNSPSASSERGSKTSASAENATQLIETSSVTLVLPKEDALLARLTLYMETLHLALGDGVKVFLEHHGLNGGDGVPFITVTASGGRGESYLRMSAVVKLISTIGFGNAGYLKISGNAEQVMTSGNVNQNLIGSLGQPSNAMMAGIPINALGSLASFGFPMFGPVGTHPMGIRFGGNQSFVNQPMPGNPTVPPAVKRGRGKNKQEEETQKRPKPS